MEDDHVVTTSYKAVKLGKSCSSRNNIFVDRRNIFLYEEPPVSRGRGALEGVHSVLKMSAL